MLCHINRWHYSTVHMCRTLVACSSKYSTSYQMCSPSRCRQHLRTTGCSMSSFGCICVSLKQLPSEEIPDAKYGFLCVENSSWRHFKSTKTCYSQWLQTVHVSIGVVTVADSQLLLMHTPAVTSLFGRGQTLNMLQPVRGWQKTYFYKLFLI